MNKYVLGAASAAISIFSSFAIADVTTDTTMPASTSTTTSAPVPDATHLQLKNK